MSLAALGACAASIYATFLLWALLQERLTTTPYTLPLDLIHPTQASRQEYFRSPLLLNAVQAVFSTLVASVYCVYRSRASAARNDAPLLRVLGLEGLTAAGAQRIRKHPTPTSTNGKPSAARDATGSSAGGRPSSSSSRFSPSPLAYRYALVALFQSCASQLGLLSLSHGISYPTLTLAKSCKLVPVLVANVVLYRRRFSAQKYLVVALVTLGISVFMLTGDEAERKRVQAAASGKGATSSAVGLALLLGNLALDGATNSTQDDVFANYHVSGPQMMLVMNALSSAMMLVGLLVPVPTWLSASSPKAGRSSSSLLGAASGAGVGASNELQLALSFISRHPEVLRDILGYAAAGAVGQTAIFETLERFGSLTLVSITVTRKLFTMLLSIFVYRHAMATTQWAGVAVVFAGLLLEASEKRRQARAKAEERARGTRSGFGSAGQGVPVDKVKVG